MFKDMIKGSLTRTLTRSWVQGLIFILFITIGFWYIAEVLNICSLSAFCYQNSAAVNVKPLKEVVLELSSNNTIVTGSGQYQWNSIKGYIRTLPNTSLYWFPDEFVLVLPMSWTELLSIFVEYLLVSSILVFALLLALRKTKGRSSIGFYISLFILFMVSDILVMLEVPQFFIKTEYFTLIKFFLLVNSILKIFMLLDVYQHKLLNNRVIACPK